jgi:hypothetical protein
MPGAMWEEDVSYLDFTAFEKALEKPKAFAGNPPPRRRTDLPKWLVDPDFDATMEAMYPADEAAEHRLPWAVRMATIFGLAILAWAPIVAAGVWLWS